MCRGSVRSNGKLSRNNSNDTNIRTMHVRIQDENDNEQVLPGFGIILGIFLSGASSTRHLGAESSEMEEDSSLAKKFSSATDAIFDNQLHSRRIRVTIP